MTLEKTERGIGLELVQYNASLVLVENINAEIDLQQDAWVDRDTAWNQATGQEPREVELEHIPLENIWRGHRPSLIELPIDANMWPNVSLMAYIAEGLGQEEISDQMTNYIVTLDVEAGIKASNEAEADARMHRTVEAIHQVFQREEDLNGMSFGWENDPIVRITDIFKRDADVSHGEDFFWQLSRIRYNLIRHSLLPN